MQVSSSRSTFLKWLGLGLAGLAVLSVLCAHLPVEVKKIGLFSLAFGALAGWGLGILGSKLGLRRSALMLVTAFVLITLAQLGMLLELYREYRAAQVEQPLYTTDELAMIEQWEEPVEGETPEEQANREQIIETIRENAEQRQVIQAERRRLDWYFQRYLVLRVRPLSQEPWSFAAALSFWLAEVLLASVLGTFLTSLRLNMDAPRQPE